MSKFNGCVAVVTGAGSGIGRALALELASRGAKLAISDLNKDSLDETAQLLHDSGSEIIHHQLDVADQNAVFDYAAIVAEQYQQVNLVINNAGVALASGPLWETSIDDFKWLMNINFYGVLYGTKAFLPLMQEAQWGHIVNISSLFGLVSVPEQNAYNASKFAVRGLTEALRHELEVADSSVSCTSVHPGGIRTNIARSARITEGSAMADPDEREISLQNFDKLARTTPESAAQQILRAVEKNKRRLLIGADARIIDKIQRLFPSGYGWVMKKIVSRASR